MNRLNRMYVKSRQKVRICSRMASTAYGRYLTPSPESNEKYIQAMKEHNQIYATLCAIRKGCRRDRV